MTQASQRGLDRSKPEGVWLVSLSKVNAYQVMQQNSDNNIRSTTLTIVLRLHFKHISIFLMSYVWNLII